MIDKALGDLMACHAQLEQACTEFERACDAYEAHCEQLQCEDQLENLSLKKEQEKDDLMLALCRCNLAHAHAFKEHMKVYHKAGPSGMVTGMG